MMTCTSPHRRSYTTVTCTRQAMATKDWLPQVPIAVKV